MTMHVSPEKQEKPVKPSFWTNKGTAAAAVGTAAIIGFGVASVDRTVDATPLSLSGAEATVIPGAGFADLVERVAPAVVSVRVVQAQQVETEARSPFPKGHPMERYFRGAPSEPRRGPRAEAQGSGFVISKDGYIVTNHHVIDEGSSVTVVFNDGSEHEATIVGADEKTDLALLKVEADDLPYVSFDESDGLRVGDWVVAVGNPFGLGGTVTTGIVSARGRDIGAGPYDDFIQIDASINQGNSGGPTFDLSGNVVGVNTAIYSPTGGNVGIGFAIPANVAADVIADLKEDGRVERGWLGVAIQPVGPEIAETLGLEEGDGALVSQVMGDSPAEAGGLEPGDVIRAINGVAMAEPKDVSRSVAALKAGASAEFDIWRDGDDMTLQIEIGAHPDNEQVVALVDETHAEEVLGGLGLALAETPDGIIVRGVLPASEAAEKGLQRGDLILEIGGQPVASIGDVVDDITRAKEEERKSVLFLVRSGSGQRFVALSLRDI